MAQTSFIETEALIAVMNEDDEEAERLLNDLQPSERGRLAAHAEHLAWLARGRTGQIWV